MTTCSGRNEIGTRDHGDGSSYDLVGGTVSVRVDKGAGSSTFVYDPYGLPSFYVYSGGSYLPAGNWTSPTGADFLFQGRWYYPLHSPGGDKLRLYHFRNRTYAPKLGRFLQRDPLFPTSGRNGYDFLSDRVLSRVDPSGLLFVAQSRDDSDPSAFVKWFLKALARICPCYSYEASKPLPWEPHRYVERWKEGSTRVKRKMRKVWHIDLVGPARQSASWKDFCCCYVKHRKGCNLLEDMFGYGDLKEFENLWSSLMIYPLRRDERKRNCEGVTSPGRIRITFHDKSRDGNTFAHEAAHARHMYRIGVDNWARLHKEEAERPATQAGNEISREIGHPEDQRKDYYVNLQNYDKESGLLDDTDRHNCGGFLAGGQAPPEDDDIYTFFFFLFEQAGGTR